MYEIREGATFTIYDEVFDSGLIPEYGVLGPGGKLAVDEDGLTVRSKAGTARAETVAVFDDNEYPLYKDYNVSSLQLIGSDYTLECILSPCNVSAFHLGLSVLSPIAPLPTIHLSLSFCPDGRWRPKHTELQELHHRQR